MSLTEVKESHEVRWCLRRTGGAGGYPRRHFLAYAASGTATARALPSACVSLAGGHGVGISDRP